MYDQVILLRFLTGIREFSSPKHPDRICVPPTPIFRGFRLLLILGIEQPVFENDYSPPSSSEVKDIWSFSSSPPYAYVA
jgi:hypothetical protein